jgi:hypothetical protein
VIHPKIVSERLGHSSVSITLDTYSHPIPGMQEAAAEAMEDSPTQSAVEVAILKEQIRVHK